MLKTLLLGLEELRAYRGVTAARAFQLLAFDVIVSRDLGVHVCVAATVL